MLGLSFNQYRFYLCSSFIHHPSILGEKVEWISRRIRSFQSPSLANGGIVLPVGYTGPCLSSCVPPFQVEKSVYIKIFHGGFLFFQYLEVFRSHLIEGIEAWNESILSSSVYRCRGHDLTRQPSARMAGSMESVVMSWCSLDVEDLYPWRRIEWDGTLIRIGIVDAFPAESLGCYRPDGTCHTVWWFLNDPRFPGRVRARTAVGWRLSSSAGQQRLALMRSAILMPNGEENPYSWFPPWRGNVASIRYGNSPLTENPPSLPGIAAQKSVGQSTVFWRGTHSMPCQLTAHIIAKMLQLLPYPRPMPWHWNGHGQTASLVVSLVQILVNPFLVDGVLSAVP